MRFRRGIMFAGLVAAVCVGLADAPTQADPCGMVPPVYVGDAVPIARIGQQKTYVFFKDGVRLG